jgi:DnaJ-class molecular chaperone
LKVTSDIKDCEDCGGTGKVKPIHGDFPWSVLAFATLGLANEILGEIADCPNCDGTGKVPAN